MSTDVRTYRVTVRGEFRELGPEQRARLLAEVEEHDLLRAGYPAEGFLSYDASLRPFTIRCTVVQGADRPDQEAVETGELVALELLEAEGLGHAHLRATATCLDDVKINRKRR